MSRIYWVKGFNPSALAYIRFRLAWRVDHVCVLVTKKICHLIIRMIFQPVSLVYSILVSLVCWMTRITLRKETSILQCCRVSTNRQWYINSHKGPLWNIRTWDFVCYENNLSVLLKILTVNGPTAGTLDGGGVSTVGGGGLLVAAAWKRVTANTSISSQREPSW